MHVLRRLKGKVLAGKGEMAGQERMRFKDSSLGCQGRLGLPADVAISSNAKSHAHRHWAPPAYPPP